jgi:hypothetical protein
MATACGFRYWKVRRPAESASAMQTFALMFPGLRPRAGRASARRAVRGEAGGRPRLAALLLATLGFATAACPGVAEAAQVVRTGEVTVPLTEQNAAFQEAMRVALVRITGRRDAAQDPAFAPLLADARRYVQIFRPLPGGAGTQVTLDSAALERAVTAAGRGTWPRERPVALVVVAQPPPGADPAAVRRAIEDAAAQRGLPVLLSSAQSAGLAAGSVDSAAALAAARRLGADVALVGQADGPDPSQWRWTYFGGGAGESFAGSVGAGIHGAVDRLAAATEAVMQQPESDALVQVNGVATLRDHAQVSRLLAASAGVRAVSLLEAGNGYAVYRVLARGGGDGLAAALASNSRLRPATDATGRLAYQYAP